MRTDTETTDLDATFGELTAMLRPYARHFEERSDAKGGYHLWSRKTVVVDGRTKKDVYFAGAIPQKRYVSLYYMPVYAEPEQKALFKPELLARLKGKSCFHLRKLDAALKAQIVAALDSCLKLYKERGWV